MTFSKYAKSGFWFTDQISIKDEVGNERHSGVDDFGWKLFLDNALEDVEAPQYIEDSFEMMLETAVVEGQTMQRLEGPMEDYREPNDGQSPKLLCVSFAPVPRPIAWSSMGLALTMGMMALIVAECLSCGFPNTKFYRSGDYTVQMIRIFDEAGNEQRV